MMEKTDEDRVMVVHWEFYGIPKNGNPTPEFNAKLWAWFKERGRYLIPKYATMNPPV